MTLSLSISFCYFFCFVYRVYFALLKIFDLNFSAYDIVQWLFVVVVFVADSSYLMVKIERLLLSSSMPTLLGLLDFVSEIVTQSTICRDRYCPERTHNIQRHWKKVKWTHSTHRSMYRCVYVFIYMLRIHTHTLSFTTIHMNNRMMLTHTQLQRNIYRNVLTSKM